MNIQEFQQQLAANPSATVAFQFGSGSFLAEHFHVTEVGKVIKDFVDCGGTRRTSEACVLQSFVANDTDHRLAASKLSAILAKAAVLEISGDLEMELEVQSDTIGIYSVTSCSLEGQQLCFRLGAKRTACLDPQKCGLEVLPVLGGTVEGGDCCGDTGCC